MDCCCQQHSHYFRKDSMQYQSLPNFMTWNSTYPRQNYSIQLYKKVWIYPTIQYWWRWDRGCFPNQTFGTVWSGALTTGNKQDIERVQRNAMRIIFLIWWVSGGYWRRIITDKLCVNFARNCLKHEKSSQWFIKGVRTSSGFHFYEAEHKTKRNGNFALPHLIRLLNIQAH